MKLTSKAHILSEDVVKIKETFRKDPRVWHSFKDLLEGEHDFLRAIGVQKHTVKNIRKGLDKLNGGKEEDFHYIEEALDALWNVLQEFSKKPIRSEGQLMQDIKHRRVFYLLVHGLGATKRGDKGQPLEDVVSKANYYAQTIVRGSMKMPRRILLAMDCDLFWVKRNYFGFGKKHGKLDLFFGHPRAQYNFFSARRARHFKGVRDTTGLSLPKNVFERMRKNPFIRLNVEIKFGAGDIGGKTVVQVVEQIIELAKEYNVLRRLTFQGRDFSSLKVIKEVSPESLTILLSKDVPLAKGLKFHIPLIWTGQEAFHHRHIFRVQNTPGFVDGFCQHKPPADIFDYKQYVDNLLHHGKIPMDHIINAFRGTQKGEKAKERILQAYLAGCPGGIIEQSSIKPLLQLIDEWS